jgi:DNA repair exonuclease SbcCD ATPase subunit
LPVLTSEGAAHPGRLRRGLTRSRIGAFGLPVLLCAAVVFGASIASAIFVGVWRHADTDRRGAESALATARRGISQLQAENARLAHGNAMLARAKAGIAHEKTALAKALAASRSLVATNAREAEAERAKLLQRNRQLATAVQRLGQESRGLAAGASELAGLAAKLRSDISSLTTYLSQTSAASLDPAFLQTQLAYLKPLVEEIRSRAASLSEQSGNGAAHP